MAKLVVLTLLLLMSPAAAQPLLFPQADPSLRDLDQYRMQQQIDDLARRQQELADRQRAFEEAQRRREFQEQIRRQGLFCAMGDLRPECN